MATATPRALAVVELKRGTLRLAVVEHWPQSPNWTTGSVPSAAGDDVITPLYASTSVRNGSIRWPGFWLTRGYGWLADDANVNLPLPGRPGMVQIFALRWYWPCGLLAALPFSYLARRWWRRLPQHTRGFSVLPPA